MKCSLIICTYNWPEALNLVLTSLLNQSIMPDEIIIADDGSNNKTKELIKEFEQSSTIPLIHSWQEDLGCRISHSRNRAIAKTNYEYIIMIDGDTVLHKDFIKDHKMIAKKGFYIQGSRVLLRPEFTSKIFKNNLFIKPSFFLNNSDNNLNLFRLPFLSRLFGSFHNKNLKRVRGCNFSAFKADVLKVNGFNEEFTSWGREDSEFVQRLFNAGIFKLHLKFSGIQYHLYHNERVKNSQESAEANNYILENTFKKKLIWCKYGVDQYVE